MSTNYDAYEVVVGLEVHAQLLTDSKLFCGDSAAFGGDPNTHISPITLAHPGTLPKLNKKAISYAVKIGLACNCSITRHNYFARKNYFYPDLPKGYQLTQHTTPICVGGYVTIRTQDGGTRDIQLNRIHMEEDAGKSLHDVDAKNTCVDYNRAGVPLVEIVTEPDIHSGDEAYAYLTELRKLLRYLEICDGNMEEGSMRCDANISVRKKGDTKLGTKVEVKNLNSIRNVKRAIEFEAKRLIDITEAGEKIIQQTRSFDAGNGTTFALRTKEDANDYRYFADPDLTPFVVTDALLQEVTSSIPALPEERVARYIQQLQLPEYDARVITDEKELAVYFEQIIDHSSNYKAAANWMLGPVKSWLNETGAPITAFPVQPATIAALIALIDSNQVNFSVASTKIFAALLKEPGKEPLQIAKELNLLQDSDEGNVAAWVEEVLNKMPDKVSEYKKGKKGLIGLFVGEVKKVSKGKADPKLTNDILLKKLQ
ncbi:aspartyl/glutamyl-tRNA amidotransferase subunit B [Niastella yeongjuensis]|uniref:Aspartyl/glutamyl-tRNA(Asn/Gln) amidotransferase subunit B n=1 Tax=Niastella yeongjuensis TaxID=354355 RepID=A0A1V9ELW4_9BACT|nr:Asp-tRNA(Asn)/Glu-tRNA(Gln) amidotransferase subunit GatB [Niastella yeongjuensis]OQP47042.1 aspartyl/glutamyl-tRNA amidotransferase subunit B [Niastella yeongjuensis]SEN66858.1 aspartyl/glutamyl-tRNA(Asn/Gln) amidotransferase subunit B [Niastella yeongjuensis]